MNKIIEVVLDFRDRDMYDRLSISYIKSGILGIIIKAIMSAEILKESEYSSVARIFELCACHSQGIQVMNKYLKQIIEYVNLFMRTTQFDTLLVKYPAATVLLDLTASEMCIEKVAQMVKSKDLLTVVNQELKEALARKIPKNCANRVYLNRYRDLMIGIVLNLTCNVENESVMQYMVFEQDIIEPLCNILVDSRHDWPTNGAALALLQFSHAALSNQAFYTQLHKHKVLDKSREFLNSCTN